jgi:NAD(P)-dependent dehydrogenase (short-subunit alcohol dehydrogenase family)
MAGRLRDKTAIITGAASGIGRESALLFASEGANVVVADMDEAAGEESVARIVESGGSAAFVRVDVSSAAEVESMIRFAEETFGSVEILFNNAGIFHPDDGSVVETTEEIWDRVISIDLKSVYLGCRYGIPALLRAGGGSIINTASFVALMGAAVPQIAYTAAKGGVLSMTREIAVEFARRNIRANALCPGPVETPLLAQLLSDPERRNRRLVHIPQGRFARPDEMANAALFLASDESSYVNGATFVVDGGITAAYITPE